MNTLLHDIRHGVRMLLKHKGFSAVAIIALGLGIGANTAIFSLVNGVLLRPLPFPNSDRIIYFGGKNPAAGITDSNISYLDFTDWSQQTDLFASTAAYWTGNADLSGDGAEPEAVPRAGVTTGFFSVLGVQPVLGRAIVPEDDKPATFNEGRGTVAIISHGLWKRRFGSDPAIIGRVVQMKSRPLTVIGVMPPGFEYPEQTQIWVNSAVNLSQEPRDNRAWSAIARLNPNVDLKQAQTRVSAINARLDKQFHETNKGSDVSLWTLHERLGREVKPSVPALQASKLDVTSALKEGGRSGEGHRRTSARSLLLIGEVALSLMLLVGAGLLIKSFLRLQEIRPGFNAHNVLIANLALPYPKYKYEQFEEFFRQLKEWLEAEPGVQAAGGSMNLPLNASGYAIGRGFIPEGRPLTVDENRDAMFSSITGDYFRALQIPLLSGRTFELHDNADAPKVVIINETIAKRHFGSPAEAIGKRLSIWRDEKFMREIVGVVGDTKTGSLTGEGGAHIYVPNAQARENFMGLVIRTAGDPAAF